ncbi:uncharacterized protein LOC106469401, partial [Limulus polyphemus]|uniref:Uncharacterized protein LOC106469401 n=1 Tax=Limulus polyphemus TaxID=6850 RepID=A0ABM1TCL9_LIMPO
MEFQKTDFQFLDLNDIPEKEANEICEILNCTGDNSYVELPWKDETPISNFPSASDNVECENDEDLTLACYIGHDTTVFPQVANVNTSVAHPPFLPVVTSVSYLPADQPFSFIPSTYPVIPQYLGLPLFTQNIPQQDLNTGQTYHYQIPYPQPILCGNNFTTVTCRTNSDKVSVGQDSKQNGQLCEKQYPRRNRKKRPFNCYSSLEMCINSDAYQTGSVILANQLANVIPLSDHSVLSHNPVVPFSVPPPNYPLTNGTIPLPGILSEYPLEMTTMQYSPMAHPQTESAPIFCVPVIPSPYHGYIHHPTPPPTVHQVMDGSQNCDVYLPHMSLCVTVSEVHNYSYCQTTVSSDSKTTVASIDNSVNSCITEHNIDDSAAVSQIMQPKKTEVETNDIPGSEWGANSEQSFTPTPVTSEPEVEGKTDCMSSPISVVFDEVQSVSTPEHLLDQDSGVSLPSNDEVETSMNSGLQQHQSWADLFKMMSLENSTSGKENLVDEMMSSSVMSHRTSDVKACKIAKILTSLRLNHAAPFLIPRGLVNHSNWCCVNAVSFLMIFRFYRMVNMVLQIWYRTVKVTVVFSRHI